MGERGGGGKSQRGDKGDRPERCDLIYPHGPGCTADLSVDGCVEG